jgi:signal peptidase I
VIIKILKIKGISMSPSLKDGDFVVSINPKLSKIKKGDVITFNHSKYGFMIKEIAEVKKEGYIVKGEHYLSTSSESIGLVTKKMIEGKVILKIKDKKI